MKIFIIAGKAESGKDKLGEYMKKILEEKNYKPCILHFTKPLYEYAETYFGWNGDFNKKPRELLQTLGYDIIQKELGKKYFLADRILEDIEILEKYFNVFIIADGRLISEFERVKKKYPSTKVIKIERDTYNNKLTKKEKEHITENNLEDYNEYDYIVHNINKDDLYTKAMSIIEKEIDV